ncbi:MAG TPA: hypothetical protein VK453_20895 [Micromonosporaceae bacterium]|nr:hypothetical protein [Micromonosporaceae bacterium]
MAGGAALAVAGLLLSASPARAEAYDWAWSGSWQYVSSSAIHLQATTPGAGFVGRATDDNGTRTLSGSLTDHVDDDHCVRARVYAVGGGFMAEAGTCAPGDFRRFATGSFGQDFMIVLDRLLPGSTEADRTTYLYVPGSAGDPGLRAPGSGMQWAYTNPEATRFEYRVSRPGARVGGKGVRSDGGSYTWLDWVQKTDAASGCVTGRASSPSAGTEVNAVTCTTDPALGSGTLHLTDSFHVQACSQPTYGPEVCVLGMVPEPHRR